ncbi:MAG: FAD-binding oxidoreductase [Phototrophicaceae bacterium]
MYGTKRYTSWGRYPKAQPDQIVRLQWLDQLPRLDEHHGSMLPFGLGRSYGDSCLNDGGTLLDTTALNRFIAFDRASGILRCEAGVSLAQILELVVPHGWFLPVSPGTKFVTLGGAIANDVHGKNHHKDGTFGRHVTCFELLRSDGERLVCSPTQNSDYYRATIGGLGLTGLILWAEFQLKRVPSYLIDSEDLQFNGIDDFFELSRLSTHYTYSVSWLDCTAGGDNFGRGVFNRGEFFDPPLGVDAPHRFPPILPVPFDFPNFTVNNVTTTIFNQLFYHKQIFPVRRSVKPYHSFFYPLDVAADWYYLYGKNGFVQYQLVVPYQDGYDHVKEIFRLIVRSGQASPLIVFKTFGTLQSPGILSFPREGVTLAIDFAFKGETTLQLLNQLDEIVFAVNGALYPAKDARMSGEAFRKSFPNWETFVPFIDPKFSSSFWRRINAK